ncbi:MAG: AsmA-like C-terminal region-containing protein [Planctomycetota bacterium]
MTLPARKNRPPDKLPPDKGPGANPAREDRSRTRRRWVPWLFGAGALGLLVAALPYLASTALLRPLALQVLGSLLKLDLEAQSLLVRWSGRLELGAGGVRLHDSGPRPLSWSKLAARVTLAKLASGSLEGEIELVEPRLEIATDPAAERAFEDLYERLRPALTHDGKGSNELVIKVRAGNVTFLSQANPAALRDVDLHLASGHRGWRELDLSLHAETATAHGSVRASLATQRDPAGKVSWQASRALLQVDLEDLPLQPFARLLAPLLGVETVAGQLTAHLDVTADGERGGHVRGTVVARLLGLSGGPFATRPLHVTHLAFEADTELDLHERRFETRTLSVSTGSHWLRVHPGRLRMAAGRVEGELVTEAGLDLSRIASDLRSIFTPTRDMSGLIEAILRVNGDAARTLLELKVDARHLSYLDRHVAEEPFEPSWLGFELATEIGPDFSWISIDRLRAESGGWTLDEAAGEIRDPLGRRGLDFAGKLALDLDRISEQYLRFLAPDIELSGAADGQVSVTHTESGWKALFDAQLENAFAELAGQPLTRVRLGSGLIIAELQAAERERFFGAVSRASLSFAGESFELGVELAEEESCWALTTWGRLPLAQLGKIFPKWWPRELDAGGECRLIPSQLRFHSSGEGTSLIDAEIAAEIEKAQLFRRGTLRPAAASSGTFRARLRADQVVDKLNVEASMGGGTVHLGASEITLLESSLTLDDTRLVLHGAKARLDGGDCQASGHLELSGEAPRFDFAIEARSMRPRGTLLQWVSIACPLFVASPPGESITLDAPLDLSFKAAGRGLTEEALLRTLTGDLQMQIGEGVLGGAHPLRTICVELLGHPEIALRASRVEATISRGHFTCDRQTIDGKQARVTYQGSSTLEGELSYTGTIEPIAAAEGAARTRSFTISGTLASPLVE